MTPAWQRRGVLVYKKITEKEGFNPITQETRSGRAECGHG